MASGSAVKLMVWTLDPAWKGVSVEDTNSTAGQLKAKVIDKLGLSSSFADVFAIWMTSPMLSFQLKDHNVPSKLYKKWKRLLTEHTTAEYDTIQGDEPILTLQRNVFLTMNRESQITDEKVTHLLYKEAVYNVLRNYYPMADDELVELAGMQAVVDLQWAPPGEYNEQYFRNKLADYFPQYKLPTKMSTLTKWFSKRTAPALEEQLASKYRDLSGRPAVPISPSAHTKSLSPVDKYLKLCRSKPYYGSAFFSGQVAKRVNIIRALLPHLMDRSVIVAINMGNVCILEDAEPREVLLQLPLKLLFWDLEEPQEEGDTIFSCLWLGWSSQAPARPQGEGTGEGDKRLPIYSRQAAMMNALLSSAHQINLSEEQSSSRSQEEVCEHGQCLVCDTWTDEGRWKEASYFTHTRTLEQRDMGMRSKTVPAT